MHKYKMLFVIVSAITTILYDLTKDDDIIVLMAVAIGSRAYGCAGPNSDYDIRFIYKRPEEAYLDVMYKQGGFRYVYRD